MTADIRTIIVVVDGNQNALLTNHDDAKMITPAEVYDTKNPRGLPWNTAKVIIVGDFVKSGPLLNLAMAIWDKAPSKKIYIHCALEATAAYALSYGLIPTIIRNQTAERPPAQTAS